jgi:hypothetical protein
MALICEAASGSDLGESVLRVSHECTREADTAIPSKSSQRATVMSGELTASVNRMHSTARAISRNENFFVAPSHSSSLAVISHLGGVSALGKRFSRQSNIVARDSMSRGDKESAV